MEFKIAKKSKKSRARLGFLKTSHGVVETPSFVPVATRAVVKTLTSEEVLQTKSQILIANTFHLHLKPGEKLLKNNGGIHKFMKWPKPLMTDSGGFQVFSLGFGKDHGVGKILKKISETGTRKNLSPGLVKFGQQPKLLKITEDGVKFTSYYDGKELFLGPKESIKIQGDIGADIIFAFDECTSPLADYEYTKKSMEVTHKWAKICLKIGGSRLRSGYGAPKQAMYGIVQGGKYKDLRIESAKIIGGMEFEGFGIGGEFGDDKSQMTKMLKWVINELPKDKPRHLLGIGHPDDMLKIVKEGIDTFDCIAPTHYARRGAAFTSIGKIDLNKTKFINDKKPIDKNCDCSVCQNYTRGYIHYLLRAHEITPLKLLTFHNLYFFNSYMEKIREGIKKGKI